VSQLIGLGIIFVFTSVSYVDVYGPRLIATPDLVGIEFRNLDADIKHGLMHRYEDLSAHCCKTPSRYNNGVAHENGFNEGAHGHLKCAVRS